MTNFLDYCLKHNFHSIIIYILIGLFIYKLLKIFIKNWTKRINIRRRKTIEKLIRNTFKYIIITLVGVQILNALGINVTSIAAGLGIAGVIIGLALQDVMKDILVGLSIIFEEQFDVGDYVEINGFEGTVIDLGLKSTKIESYENIVKTISNRNITEVSNYSKNDINVRINIPIPYDVENPKAEKVISQIVERIEKEIELVDKINIWGLNNFNPSDIEYTILLPVKAEKQWEVKRKAKKIIKEEFDNSKISIPFNIIEVRNG